MLRTLLVAGLALMPASLHAAVERPAVETDTLLHRIECLSFVQSLAARYWDRIQPAADWTVEKQLAWAIVESADLFEERLVRPHIDATTQEVLMETYWPDGLLAGDIASRSEMCETYRALDFLRHAMLAHDDFTRDARLFRAGKNDTRDLPDPIKNPGAYGLQGDRSDEQSRPQGNTEIEDGPAQKLRGEVPQ